jgi:mannose-6-phosphate isomerase-like protein (cupin superfamily)
MIRAGDTIVNPATGERVTFLKTSAETDGASVLIETVVEPDGAVAAAHVHPSQSETFEVVSGRLGMKAGGKKVELGPGEGITVLPGTAHKFWNAGDVPVRFVCEVRPALGFESLLETMYALAADGKTNRKGMPNPLRLAVIARAHFDVVRLPRIPVWMQRAGLALGAPIGRLAGYSAEYAPSGARAPLPAEA